MALPQARSIRRAALALLLVCAASSGPATAGETTAAHVQFFESEVRPLLAEHCWKCHGQEEQKGKLRLDSRGAMLQGGETGSAIVAGKPDDSLLMQAVRYEGYEMPPTGRLSNQQTATLAKWIELGAPWPGDDDAPPPRVEAQTFTPEDRRWWAIQPVVQPVAPQVQNSNWPRNEIDQFILAELNQQGLTPAAEADRAALIRRVYFDLVGLPPPPTEVAAFVADPSLLAYDQLVDRLLASTQYGERWARHWLDLVRYADSDGYRIDHYRPDAWRYRDYVIHSLNDDKPYGRFVQEQLAGDELFPNDPQAQVATGYLRHGIYEYNNRDVRGQRDTILNELTDTTADVFLGVGLQCARCHDHKFDPLLQRDYFRLRAFFEPILPRDAAPLAPSAAVAEHAEVTAKWESQTAALHEELAKLEAPYLAQAEKTAVERFPADLQAILRKPAAERSPYEHQLYQLAWRQVEYEYTTISGKFKGDDKKRVAELRGELAKFDAYKPAPLPTALAANDVGPVSPPTIVPKKRISVEPGFLSLLDEQPAVITQPSASLQSTGRRSALAQWLTRADNPLTTRVIVNRVWQYHFGRGLAPNGSDFGRLSEPPSHPELLDWLTADFVDHDWQLKRLHRMIVTSATYRQSTAHASFADFTLRDPTNRCYWRADTRRLDAEQIRDALLTVAGKLDPASGGPGVEADQPRRSIFTRVMRNSRDPLLDVFDLPQGISSVAARDATTTPLQSLLLLNDSQMLKYASALAERSRPSRTEGVAAMPDEIASLIGAVWGRKPMSDEISAALDFVAAQATHLQQSGKTDDADWQAYVDLCHVLLNSNQFLYVH